MKRLMSLRAIAYYATIASMTLGGLYVLIESHDSWADGDHRKFIWKTLSAFLTFAALTIMTLNPPD